MRVGLAHRPVRQVRDTAGVSRGKTTAETGAGQIEGAPEEMDGAALPNEAAAEFLQHAIGLGHRGPAAVHGVAVVGAMLAVVGEAECVCHLPGNRPDLYRRS